MKEGKVEPLLRIGAEIRLARKRQKVSAVTAAEAAGISRVTLHRIERGEPTVAVGAWVAVAKALGLQLGITGMGSPAGDALPDRIRLADYPQLRQLAWQLEGVEELEPQEALALYERNWRHVDRASLSASERALIQALSATLGGGKLLV
ncbi:MAG: helix-turn-helix domain-containing protein [Burkholderiales bacterium]|nr:helix-turn-helix domain-containing protein [Burkholderiales bacterium]